MEIELIKKMIEERYSRLTTGHERRPSMEYVTPETIREVFSKFVSNPENLEQLSDEEILDLYGDWFAANVERFRESNRNTEEIRNLFPIRLIRPPEDEKMSLPDIDENSNTLEK